MKQSQIYILSSSFKKAQMVLGFLLLACGCSIYMIFRNQDIVLNKWCQSLGIADFVEPMRMSVKDSHVPDFILYSLPDGLYCASYILLMDAAWEGKGLSRNIAVALIPSVAIMHEIAQDRMGKGHIRHLRPNILRLALGSVFHMAQISSQKRMNIIFFNNNYNLTH